MLRRFLTIPAMALIAAAAACLFAQDIAPEKNATQPADEAAGNSGSPPAEARVVYSQDFEKEIGGEWSSTTTSVTPAGNRKFLGELSNGKVTLSLDKLPEHKYIRLSFDLYIIRSWDGNFIQTSWDQVVGPNVITVSVQGGPVLMNSSFANISEYNQKQSYPDSYGAADYDPRTGAVEKDTLGYIFYQMKMDAVYKVSFLLPHRGDAIKIDFFAASLQNIEDESWGLDNVEAAIFDGSPSGSLDADRLKALWGDLRGGDPVKADKALWTLLGAENTADVTNLLVGNLKLPEEAPGEVSSDVAKLIAELDDDNWQVRDKATEALKKMGDKVIPVLRRTLTETKSAEVRQRVNRILESAAASGSTNNMNLLVSSRVIRMLRIIGSEETKKAIEAIEKQYPQLKPSEPAKETTQPEVPEAKG